MGELPGDPRGVAFTDHVRWALRRDRHWTKTEPKSAHGCRMSFGARSREGASGRVSGI